MMKFLVAVLVILLAFPAIAGQQAQFRWTPPVTGSPVVEYQIEMSLDGGAFTWIAATPDTFFTYEFPYDTTIQVRVAGMDALDRVGPWSEPSDPQYWESPPSVPGKPVFD